MFAIRLVAVNKYNYERSAPYVERCNFRPTIFFLFTKYLLTHKTQGCSFRSHKLSFGGRYGAFFRLI